MCLCLSDHPKPANEYHLKTGQRTLRPEAIKTVRDWAISYRRFWEESFDNLDVVVNQMKKEAVRDDRKHG